MITDDPVKVTLCDNVLDNFFQDLCDNQDDGWENLEPIFITERKEEKEDISLEKKRNIADQILKVKNYSCWQKICQEISLGNQIEDKTLTELFPFLSQGNLKLINNLFHQVVIHLSSFNEIHLLLQNEFINIHRLHYEMTKLSPMDVKRRANISVEIGRKVVGIPLIILNVLEEKRKKIK
jgi:hypothetical protein